MGNKNYGLTEEERKAIRKGVDRAVAKDEKKKRAVNVFVAIAGLVGKIVEMVRGFKRK
jgi:hypothetical protein